MQLRKGDDNADRKYERWVHDEDGDETAGETWWPFVVALACAVAAWFLLR